MMKHTRKTHKKHSVKHHTYGETIARRIVKAEHSAEFKAFLALTEQTPTIRELGYHYLTASPEAREMVLSTIGQADATDARFVEALRKVELDN